MYNPCYYSTPWHTAPPEKKHTAVGTAAHGHHPPRLGHLVIHLAQCRCHFVCQRARYNHHITLARGRAKDDAKTVQIVASSTAMHHFYSTARQTKRHGPHAALACPVDKLVELGNHILACCWLGQGIRCHAQGRAGCNHACSSVAGRSTSKYLLLGSKILLKINHTTKKNCSKTFYPTLPPCEARLAEEGVLVLRPSTENDSANLSPNDFS